MFEAHCRKDITDDKEKMRKRGISELFFFKKQNLTWQIIIYRNILKILFQKLCYMFILSCCLVGFFFFNLKIFIKKPR